MPHSRRSNVTAIAARTGWQIELSHARHACATAAEGDPHARLGELHQAVIWGLAALAAHRGELPLPCPLRCQHALIATITDGCGRMPEGLQAFGPDLRLIHEAAWGHGALWRMSEDHHALVAGLHAVVRAWLSALGQHLASTPPSPRRGVIPHPHRVLALSHEALTHPRRRIGGRDPAREDTHRLAEGLLCPTRTLALSEGAFHVSTEAGARYLLRDHADQLASERGGDYVALAAAAELAVEWLDGLESGAPCPSATRRAAAREQAIRLHHQTARAIGMVLAQSTQTTLALEPAR